MATLCYNQLYVDMWGIRRGLTEAANHARLIKYWSNHLKNSHRFQRLTKEIYSTWPPESFDVHQLEDARVFERYTKIKLVERRNVGRVELQGCYPT
jgi:hypothetical protein